MKVALCQRFTSIGGKASNLDSMRTALADVDADLLVFPESFLTGYAVRDKFFELAEPVPGPSSEALAEAVKGTGKALVYGAPVRDRESSGALRNSAVFLSPDGRTGQYAKRRLAGFGPFEERLYFQEGSEFPIFEIRGVRFGVLICYDLFFPEISKAYALAGADLLICISASPSTTRPFFEKVAPARAIENTAYFALCNNVGTQGNLVFWGGSAVYGPRGAPVAKAKHYEEDTAVAEIDLDAVRIARENRPTIRDSLDSP